MSSLNFDKLPDDLDDPFQVMHLLTASRGGCDYGPARYKEGGSQDTLYNGLRNWLNGAERFLELETEDLYGGENFFPAVRLFQQFRDWAKAVKENILDDARRADAIRRLRRMAAAWSWQFFHVHNFPSSAAEILLYELWSMDEWSAIWKQMKKRKYDGHDFLDEIVDGEYAKSAMKNAKKPAMKPAVMKKGSMVMKTKAVTAMKSKAVAMKKNSKPAMKAAPAASTTVLKKAKSSQTPKSSKTRAMKKKNVATKAGRKKRKR